MFGWPCSRDDGVIHTSIQWRRQYDAYCISSIWWTWAICAYTGFWSIEFGTGITYLVYCCFLQFIIEASLWLYMGLLMSITQADNALTTCLSLFVYSWRASLVRHKGQGIMIRVKVSNFVVLYARSIMFLCCAYVPFLWTHSLFLFNQYF